MLEVARGKAEAEEFTVPTGVETVDVNRDSGKRSGFGCLGDPEVFLLGTAPTESCGHLRLREARAGAAGRGRARRRARAAARRRNLFQRLFGWIGRGN